MEEFAVPVVVGVVAEAAGSKSVVGVGLRSSCVVGAMGSASLEIEEDYNC